MNRTMLTQVRSGVTAKIGLDPTAVTISRLPLTDGGFDTCIEDPTGTAVPYKCTVRISHDSKGPADYQSSPNGFSTNLFRYVLADYTSDLHEGDRIAWQSKVFMVGPIDPLTFMGEVIGYQASLKEAVTV